MIEFVVISIMVVFCYIGVIRKIAKRPVCYKCLSLRPTKNFSFCKFCIFESNKIDVITVPNFGIFLVWGHHIVKLNINLNDTKIKSICNMTNYMEKYHNSYYRVCKSGILLNGNGCGCIEFAKPNCDYTIDRNSKIIVFDKKYILRFENFSSIEICGSENICINFAFQGTAKIDFVNFGLKMQSATRKEKLKKYFGFYDTTQWKIVPNFSTIDFNHNLLKAKYIQNLLLPQNKTINAPEFCNRCDRLNLTEMGFSKLIKITQSKNKIVIYDLLANFDCVINGVTNFKRYAIFGEDFLVLQNSNFSVAFLPSIINNKFLNSRLIIGEKVEFGACNSFKNFLFNTNRLILHGAYFYIEKLVQTLNIKFLNEKIKLLLGNLLLNYCVVFGQTRIWKNTKFRNLLLSNLKFALKTNSITAYNFLKKILLFVKNEKLYNLIFERILALRKNLKNIDYEYVLGEKLGLRMVGNLLYLDIPFEKVLDCKTWFSGHMLIIKKPKNTKNIKLDDIIYAGLNCINLNNCDASVFVEFVD